MLRDTMGCPDVPFGGNGLVLGGDFRQILLIFRRVDKRVMPSLTLRAMPWGRSEHVSHHSSTRNMRADGDQEYATFLEEIGDGTYASFQGDVAVTGCNVSTRRLPKRIVPPYDWTMVDMMQWVYGGYETVEAVEWVLCFMSSAQSLRLRMRRPRRSMML